VFGVIHNLARSTYCYLLKASDCVLPMGDRHPSSHGIKSSSVTTTELTYPVCH